MSDVFKTFSFTYSNLITIYVTLKIKLFYLISKMDARFKFSKSQRGGEILVVDNNMICNNKSTLKDGDKNLFVLITA
jgi:hypothetical protein